MNCLKCFLLQCHLLKVFIKSHHCRLNVNVQEKPTIDCNFKLLTHFDKIRIDYNYYRRMLHKSLDQSLRCEASLTVTDDEICVVVVEAWSSHSAIICPIISSCCFKLGSSCFCIFSIDCCVSVATDSSVSRSLSTKYLKKRRWCA